MQPMVYSTCANCGKRETESHLCIPQHQNTGMSRHVLLPNPIPDMSKYSRRNPGSVSESGRVILATHGAKQDSCLRAAQNVWDKPVNI